MITAPLVHDIDVPAFAGPLDLLLHLIERQELDVTAISLAEITEQYLSQVALLPESRVESLIDFVVIGARLVLIKSRALLPQSPVTVFGEEEEEDPAAALIRQLLAYKAFKQAAEALHERELAGWRTYLRIAPPPKMEGKLDLSGVTTETLQTSLMAALARADTRAASVTLARPRRFTIEGQIARLRRTVQEGERLDFRALFSSEIEWVEVSVTLLAVLELVKRQELGAEQSTLFGPISIFGLAPPGPPAA